MQWIILIGNQNLTLDRIKRVQHHNCVNSYDVGTIKNRYCVDFGDDHIFYDFEDTPFLDEYENDELKNIPFKNPNFIIMTYTSLNIVREVLQQADFPNDIYVDNDFGLILPIKDFIALDMPVEW